MGNVNAINYGTFYWGIYTKETEGDCIYLYADTVNVAPDGSLVFTSQSEKNPEKQTRFIVASGKWTIVFAASMMDGSPVAVDHWKEQISEDEAR